MISPTSTLQFPRLLHLCANTITVIASSTALLSQSQPRLIWAAESTTSEVPSGRAAPVARLRVGRSAHSWLSILRCRANKDRGSRRVNSLHNKNPLFQFLQERPSLHHRGPRTRPALRRAAVVGSRSTSYTTKARATRRHSTRAQVGLGRVQSRLLPRSSVAHGEPPSRPSNSRSGPIRSSSRQLGQEA